MNNLKIRKLFLTFVLIFAFGAKVSAQSDDIDNKTTAYAYIKDVKKVGSQYAVTFDKVILKHNSATGDVKIINNNKRLRTVLVAPNAELILWKCNKVMLEDLIKQKSKFIHPPKDANLPIIGFDKAGKICAINFCYG